MLTVSSFFKNYIINPFSIDIPKNDRIKALVLSVLLGMIMLGIPHLAVYCLRQRNISQVSDFANDRAAQVAKKAQQITVDALRIQPAKMQKLNKQNVVKAIGEVITNYYSQPLPKQGNVTVCYKGKVVKWVSLTTAQKRELLDTHALEHNKLKPGDNEDQKFFGSGNHIYLTHDPRQHHGSDHGVRAAILAPIFGYLYNKYHPKYTVSHEELLLAQIAAACHDSGRQAEGIDVFDEMSAQNAVKILENMGISPMQVRNCFDAIAHKDSKPLEPVKCLIAKCVQNADSAEYTRLFLRTPVQDGRSFNYSRHFLDIYKEMSHLAAHNGEFPLKNGLNYGHFLYELDTLRIEINHLIYTTHQMAERELNSQPGKDYYLRVLAKITKEQYPLMHDILKSVELK